VKNKKFQGDARAVALGLELASLKHQAKKLHKASARVFGDQLSIEVCREAVAAANGYKSWGQAMSLATGELPDGLAGDTLARIVRIRAAYRQGLEAHAEAARDAMKAIH